MPIALAKVLLPAADVVKGDTFDVAPWQQLRIDLGRFIIWWSTKLRTEQKGIATRSKKLLVQQ